jgi:hypothetical protein
MNGYKKCKHPKLSTPRYRGLKWLEADLPRGYQLWLPGKRYSVSKDLSHYRALDRELLDLLERDRWKWPGRTIYFFSDLHGDAEAFLASLVASGGVKKTGPWDRDLKLTRSGRHALFIIGGDCFDKGPSSLQLLRVVRVLMKRGARVKILAGNHDVRLMLGIHSLFLERDIRTAHFFIRMGPKVIPLLKEINEHYLQGPKALRGIPSERECRRRIYPPKRWFSEFPSVARWVMPDDGIEREMKRLRVKLDRFEDDCRKAGLSMRMVYAAAKRWRQLFLKEKGEFAWFFDKVKLAHRAGSFLFIHAGLDDRIARIISNQGIGHLNRLFERQIYSDPFDFYYGPLANTVRTKYREVDMPLTRHGVQLVHRKGIHAIVHGHQIKLHGQRIMLRKGIINFECDATLDRNTRKREKLKGRGAAVTIFRPKGMVMGVSTDYPFIKLFEPNVLRCELKGILKRPGVRKKR